MKIFVLFSLIAISAAELNSYEEFRRFAVESNYKTVTDYAIESGFENFEQKFNSFKQEFNREYSSVELEARKFNFLKSLKYIRAHNERYIQGKEKSIVGINQFADISAEEYIRPNITFPLRPASEKVDTKPEFDDQFYATLPESFDWRTSDKVTPVKNQGKCGSCYAFASVAALEAAYAIKHSEIISLSEQQLVDCTNGMSINRGCQGGNPAVVYDYLKTHGSESEDDYPYAEKDEQCRYESSKANIKIRGYGQIGRKFVGDPPATDHEIMAAVQTHGPVAVAINALGDAFKHYKSGIITQDQRGTDHVVLLVGWGVEDEQNYWIFKNSWGTVWGEAGFGKMHRGGDFRNVNEFVFYPIL